MSQVTWPAELRRKSAFAPATAAPDDVVVPRALVSSAVAAEQQDVVPPAPAVRFAAPGSLPVGADIEPAASQLSTGIASLSFQLAQETGRQLEIRGDYTLASEVLARALAQEGLVINQRAINGLDLAEDGAAETYRSLTNAMARQQEELRNLRAPLVAREAPLLQRLCDALTMRSARELPRPARALDLLASRWQLRRVDVARYWAEFIAASGGLYTLSRASAVETLLAHLPPAAQQATWSLIHLDRSSSQFIELEEGGAEPSGAGGVSFEEYLVFRRYVEAPNLDEQFRFLWRLYDRDGDGKLGRDDVAVALQLPRALLGWSEGYAQSWAEYAFGAVRRRDADAIGPEEMLAALRRWAELRELFHARDPPPKKRAPRKSSISSLLGMLGGPRPHPSVSTPPTPPEDQGSGGQPAAEPSRAVPEPQRTPVRKHSVAVNTSSAEFF